MSESEVNLLKLFKERNDEELITAIRNDPDLVNKKLTGHDQTILMLAAGHERVDLVKFLASPEIAPHHEAGLLDAFNRDAIDIATEASNPEIAQIIYRDISLKHNKF